MGDDPCETKTRVFEEALRCDSAVATRRRPRPDDDAMIRRECQRRVLSLAGVVVACALSLVVVVGREKHAARYIVTGLSHSYNITGDAMRDNDRHCLSPVAAQKIDSLEEKIAEASTYWRLRKDAPTYYALFQTAKREAPDALTVLDVGAFESPFVTRLDWIPTKVATDIQSRPEIWEHVDGVAFIQGDFMQLKFGTRYDLVLCSQVVEHLTDEVVEIFVTKMASHASVLVVSTTHEMPHGVIEGHIQDPVSRTKFEGWFEESKRWGALTHVSFQKTVKLRHPNGTIFMGENILGVWRRHEG